jgi:hypothetical protein
MIHSGLVAAVIVPIVATNLFHSHSIPAPGTRWYAWAHREPSEPAVPEPQPDPSREPDPAPWHDPGPPVREVDLPPNSPSKGIPVENPDSPWREPSR